MTAKTAGRKRREMVFELIRKQKPDLIGMQEALRFQIDEILKAVPGLDEVGVGRDDGKAKGEFSVILYRKDRFRLDEHGTFWLSNTPEVPGSKHWGNTIPRICTWGRFVEIKGSGSGSGNAPASPGFYLFNTHLDHQSQPAREKGIKLILERIAARTHPEPFALTGDFNAPEDNPVVTLVTGATPDSSPATSTAPGGRESLSSAAARGHIPSSAPGRASRRHVQRLQRPHRRRQNRLHPRATRPQGTRSRDHPRSSRGPVSVRPFPAHRDAVVAQVG